MLQKSQKTDLLVRFPQYLSFEESEVCCEQVAKDVKSVYTFTF